MAGEQTVSGHITWKQQAGSVLQQRKIFRSSPTTRRSHFIWPGGCGQRIDTFPTVRVGYAVIRLSAPSHFFFFHFTSSVLLRWKTWHLSSLIPSPLSTSFAPPAPATSTSLASSAALLAFLPTSATFPYHVSVASFSPLPPSFSDGPVPASVTLFLSLFVVSHT